MNPTKLQHLVPLRAGIEVAVGYWSSLLHQALLLELKSWMTKLPLDVGVVIVTLTISGGGVGGGWSGGRVVSVHMKRLGMIVKKFEFKP